MEKRNSKKWLKRAGRKNLKCVTEKNKNKMAKKQGYNARLDDSLGAKHRGKHKQSLKDRRDESKAMSKKLTGRAYHGDHGMKYEGVKERNGSNIRK